MATEHIVRAFDQELEQLRRTIVEMGGIAESQIDAAVQAVVRRDSEAAGRIVRNDQRLDTAEQEVSVLAVRVLALRQPMARDLREIISALKIASDIERIGDYAANIAKRAITLAQVPSARPVTTIPRMGRLVLEIIKEVLDAYSQRDLARALAAWRRDEEVDDLYTALFRETLTYMMEDPRNITPCTHILFIAKNLERIGDHATNIAETIHFLIEGHPLLGARPKGDESSYAVASPGGPAPDRTTEVAG